MRDPKVSNVPNESKLQRALMPNSRMFLLFLIVFAVLTFFFSDRLWLSIGEGVIILLLIIYSVIMRARKRRTLERYIESVTYDTESARNNTLQNFPLPMAVFRPADSQVIWPTRTFFDLCGRHKPSVDMRITDVIPEFSGRWLLEGNTQCPELLEYQSISTRSTATSCARTRTMPLATWASRTGSMSRIMKRSGWSIMRPVRSSPSSSLITMTSSSAA